MEQWGDDGARLLGVSQYGAPDLVKLGRQHGVLDGARVSGGGGVGPGGWLQAIPGTTVLGVGIWSEKLQLHLLTTLQQLLCGELPAYNWDREGLKLGVGCGRHGILGRLESSLCFCVWL